MVHLIRFCSRTGRDSACFKSTLDLVREGMRNVAEESGTAGSLFAGFPIQVAGKTGTAENFGGADHAWFVAYAPFDHPRIVIAVLTEQGGFGALASGPVARACWKNSSRSELMLMARARLMMQKIKELIEKGVFFPCLILLLSPQEKAALARPWLRPRWLSH